MPDVELGLLRLDRLIDTSIRLRELGVDYAAIERRAAKDHISFNEALEAIDAELYPPAVASDE